MGERLTHLLLADNRIAGIQQIVTAIAVIIYQYQNYDLNKYRNHNLYKKI